MSRDASAAWSHVFRHNPGAGAGTTAQAASAEPGACARSHILSPASRLRRLAPSPLPLGAAAGVCPACNAAGLFILDNAAWPAGPAREVAANWRAHRLDQLARGRVFFFALRADAATRPFLGTRGDHSPDLARAAALARPGSRFIG